MGEEKGRPMRARIYQPSKTAMQSGRAGTDTWILEFEP
ncbi:MAG TPA: NADH dehydrogenase ubiquinone Fe-S protein 4, partial [Acetobacteraceae bacterium]|nr:NADH dehydrogenase ubiquinone Fe-S protein 4 [Acetobacteraceae bacterium]